MAPEREVDVIRRVVALLQERLPADWSVPTVRLNATVGDHEVDALLDLESPGGRAVLVVEVKNQSVVTSRLPMVAEQLS
ncbi:nuclease-related domain-containing protein [Actinopolymorpha pittospori]|uniref:Uncharacterized protein n=1 Tax=Actinopolymorpha pittospori TaxID=648752 RepID=A0A927MTS1_9ACTN|nr:nuclease-related domain-containing protein [Actinopolymorpha pittospori]MBE1603175.1 hypothetical protein [Actinopolymorpha pittospori]